MEQNLMEMRFSLMVPERKKMVLLIIYITSTQQRYNLK